MTNHGLGFLVCNKSKILVQEGTIVAYPSQHPIFFFLFFFPHILYFSGNEDFIGVAEVVEPQMHRRS